MMVTAPGTQFYRFHSNSQIAKECLGFKIPKINDIPVEIFQLVINEGMTPYDITIEFRYIYVKERSSENKD